MKVPQIKLAPKPPVLKSRRFLLFVGLLIIVLLAAGIVYFRKEDKNQGLIKEVNSLNQPGKGCEEIISKIGDKSADGYSPKAQVELLELQVNCYSDQRKLDEAINAAEQLKSVYVQQGDSKKAEEVETTIQSLRAGQKLNESDARNMENARPIE